MSTFATIQARVLTVLLDQTQVAAARVDDEVRQAQRELEDKHKFLSMLSEHEFATVEDSRGPYAYPSGYLEPAVDGAPLLVDGTGALDEIDWIGAYRDRARLYSDDPTDKGAPKHVFEATTGFEVFPYPDALAPGGTLFSDGNWRIRVPCYTRLLTLTNGTDENWFTSNAEDYLVYRAASILLQLNRSWEQALLVENQAAREMQRVIRADKKRRLTKGPLLRPVSGVRAPSNAARRYR